MLPTEGGEHIFRKRDEILWEKVLEAWKAQRKQQIVYEIDKIVASMHTRALGAKHARDCSQKQYFEKGMERKNGDRNGQKREESKYNYKKSFYRGRLGVKKINFFD